MIYRGLVKAVVREGDHVTRGPRLRSLPEVSGEAVKLWQEAVRLGICGQDFTTVIISCIAAIVLLSFLKLSLFSKL